jgi:hypothetical protein
MPDDVRRPHRPFARPTAKPLAHHGKPDAPPGLWQPPVKRPPLTCANDPRQLPFEFLRDAAEAEPRTGAIAALLEAEAIRSDK